jgi:hypothetical protein
MGMILVAAIAYGLGLFLAYSLMAINPREDDRLE